MNESNANNTTKTGSCLKDDVATSLYDLLELTRVLQVCEDELLLWNLYFLLGLLRESDLLL